MTDCERKIKEIHQYTSPLKLSIETMGDTVNSLQGSIDSVRSSLSTEIGNIRYSFPDIPDYSSSISSLQSEISSLKGDITLLKETVSKLNTNLVEVPSALEFIKTIHSFVIRVQNDEHKNGSNSSNFKKLFKFLGLK